MDPEPEPRSRLHRSRGGGSPSAPPPLPGAGGDAGAAEPQSLEEDGESCVRVFLPGISVGGRKWAEFHFPALPGRGGGEGASQEVQFLSSQDKKQDEHH